MNGTDRLLGHRLGFAAGEPRDAKVSHLDRTVRDQHDVLRLDVAVHDALIMGVLQRAQNLRHKIDSFPGVDHTLLLDILLQGDALDIFHNDILQSVAVADVKDTDDIRMRQNSNRFGFIFESAAEIFVRQILILKNLHRDNAIIDIVERFIYNGHTADADDLDDLITSVQSFADVIFHSFLSPFTPVRRQP